VPFYLLSSIPITQVKRVFLLLSEKKIAALSKDELKNWTHLDEAEEDDEDDKNHTNK
jgi:hypothetical protein